MAPLLFGAAIGSIAMYLLDPEHGRRRRALLRDKAVKTKTDFRAVIDDGVADLRNQATSVRQRAISRFKRRDGTDDVLAERVRATMGRYVSHPGAIEVRVTGGEATLSGSLLAHEHEELLSAVRTVAGIAHVNDQLSVFERAEGLSELQGEGSRPGVRSELMQDNWRPGTRLLAGSAGTVLALNALRKTGAVRLMYGLAAAAILMRTSANNPLTKLAGMSGDRLIDVEKTIQVNAPLEKVWQYLENYENFPQFMRNVRSVEGRGSGRSHWVVAGPAGSTVEWDSETTALEPNQRIAWRTVEGSRVQHSGEIRVDRVDVGTRVHVQMSYAPPGGVFGHAVASMFEADPKSQLDEDLMRLKSMLETGTAPRDAAARERSETTAS